MYNSVQKLAFAYRNCPLSLETTKHFQTYISVSFYTRRRAEYRRRNSEAVSHNYEERRVDRGDRHTSLSEAN